MSTRFKVWIDNPTDTNLLTYTDLDSDSQRTSGFSVGTAASSIRVNSMLRQNSLVAVALMDTIAPSSTTNLRSSLTDVKNEMSSYFGSFIVSGTYNDSSTSIVLTKKSGSTVSIGLSAILNKTVARATADASGNTITSTYATKSSLSNYATQTYVTNAINTAIGNVLDTGF